MAEAKRHRPLFATRRFVPVGELLRRLSGKPRLVGVGRRPPSSTERPRARSPSGSTAAGNSVALETDTTFGRKFCCAAALEKAVNSGGGRTPETISTFPALNAEIWAL